MESLICLSHIIAPMLLLIIEAGIPSRPSLVGRVTSSINGACWLQTTLASTKKTWTIYPLSWRHPPHFQICNILYIIKMSDLQCHAFALTMSSAIFVRPWCAEVLNYITKTNTIIKLAKAVSSKRFQSVTCGCQGLCYVVVPDVKQIWSWKLEV